MNPIVSVRNVLFPTDAYAAAAVEGVLVFVDTIVAVIGALFFIDAVVALISVFSLSFSFFSKLF